LHKQLTESILGLLKSKLQFQRHLPTTRIISDTFIGNCYTPWCIYPYRLPSTPRLLSLCWCWLNRKSIGRKQKPQNIASRAFAQRQANKINKWKLIGNYKQMSTENTEKENNKIHYRLHDRVNNEWKSEGERDMGEGVGVKVADSVAVKFSMQHAVANHTRRMSNDSFCQISNGS